MNKVEIYIGYTDKTWDTAIIDMPIIIPEKEVENFIEQAAIRLWTNNPPVRGKIAFAGMYNEWPLNDLGDKPSFFEALVKYRNPVNRERHCYRYIIKATNMTEATMKLEDFTPTYYTLRMRPVKQVGTNYIYNNGKQVKNITRILLKK